MMVRLNKKTNELVISLDYKAGRSLAEMVLQTIWVYGTTEENDRAIVSQMNRMIYGNQPIEDIDLMEITDKESLIK